MPDLRLPISSGTRFRVMQFNTLAKALSSPEVGNFDRLEEGALEWPFRRAREGCHSMAEY